LSNSGPYFDHIVTARTNWLALANAVGCWDVTTASMDCPVIDYTTGTWDNTAETL